MVCITEEISPVDTYYSELMVSDNPCVVLVNFYCYCYKLIKIPAYYQSFGRLLHLYGKKDIFLALLTIYGYMETPPESIISAISFQVKKKYVNLPEPPKELNPSEVEKNIMKLEKKPLKIKGNPFERE
jgi:hypothetical protein